jgi:transketolase
MNFAERARQIRRETLDLAVEINAGHLAPAFSIVEILIALDEVLHKPDKFILSKGHGCLSFYILLRQKGLQPSLSEHPDMDVAQGIECTTGSLGHGLPMGVGMAFARKLKKEAGRIYVLMSDGECQEGTTWESLLLASHHRLDNLTAIIDHNKLQALGRIEDILSLGNLRDKFAAFGWHVSEVDGHNTSEIIEALKIEANQPRIIIAHTVKGKGFSSAENNPIWHNRLPEGEQRQQAYRELA